MKNTGRGVCALSIFLSLFLVAATVSCDSVLTEDATAPTITVQPESKSGNVNDTITLSVAATSADGGTLSYQWWSSTTESTTGGTIVSDATNQSYTVPTTAKGTFYYFCVITNTNQNITGDGEKTASTTSSIAKITVSEPVDATTPAVTISDNVNVNTNSSATLTVTATSSDSGTLTYQWYSNSTESTEGGTTISGATSASYSVTPTTVGTTYYYCVVKNTIADNGDGGAKTASKTSAIATITVLSSDSVSVTIPSDKELSISGWTSKYQDGSWGDYSLCATSGFLTYTWYLDNVLQITNTNYNSWVTIPYTISVGIHEVTVVATDSDGNIYSASCNIECMGKGV